MSVVTLRIKLVVYLDTEAERLSRNHVSIDSRAIINLYDETDLNKRSSVCQVVMRSENLGMNSLPRS